MNAKLLFLPFILGASLVHGVMTQPDTTPEMEEELLLTVSKKPVEPLSEALEKLIRGISDKHFGEEFFKKIAQTEAKKFTGEYLDHWENGQLKIKAHFKNGKVDGHVHGWYDDGQEAFKAFFYENLKVGIHLAFFDGGPPMKGCVVDIARKFCYDFDGRLDDRQETSYHKGRLKTLDQYKHGIRHGKRVKYNDVRKCIMREFYEEGKLIQVKTPENK